jgi:hypothetical protein
MTAPRAHAETRKRSRSNLRGTVRLIDQTVWERQESGPYEHPGCAVEHRKRSAARDCLHAQLWRLAERPRFLRRRTTMRAFLRDEWAEWLGDDVDGDTGPKTRGCERWGGGG